MQKLGGDAEGNAAIQDVVCLIFLLGARGRRDAFESWAKWRTPDILWQRPNSNRAGTAFDRVHLSEGGRVTYAFLQGVDEQCPPDQHSVVEFL